ncbi:MAG: hypothetical protein BMS9Abin12_1759 [Acidimicrobiia bacterium]|nr:MAG: hypothetical protein BMS9Abin12_1759 [Acidimicrobiia bacterium]
MLRWNSSNEGDFRPTDDSGQLTEGEPLRWLSFVASRVFAMDDPELDPKILEYYAERTDEDARIRTGAAEIELIRTREVIRRHLPDGPLSVLDVGGGGGVHAEWLLADGLTVHLIDPVPRLVEQATKRLGSYGQFSAAAGDGRSIEFDDDSFDVVLLLGPLYHLPAREDRIRVWAEAGRVVRPGGLVFGAVISRFASLFSGLSGEMLFDDEFRAIVGQDLSDGHHRNSQRRSGWFTTAYLHRPDEVAEEAEEVGLRVRELVGVEGLAAWLPETERNWSDPKRREIIIESARLIESEPSLLGLGPHLLLVCERP